LVEKLGAERGPVGKAAHSRIGSRLVFTSSVDEPEPETMDMGNVSRCHREQYLLDELQNGVYLSGKPLLIIRNRTRLVATSAESKFEQNSAAEGNPRGQ
jgi:hypothetical protein